MLANEHLRVDGRPDDGTWSIATDDGVRGRRARTASSTAATAATPTTTRRPTEDVVVDRPDVGDASTRSSPDRCGPGSSSSRCTGGRATRSATSVVQPPRRRDRRSSRCARRSSCAPDERFLRVRIEFDNRCRDHRLRAHFPLPAPVDRSDAECAFAVVERGLTAEGGPHETAAADVRLASVRRRAPTASVGLARAARRPARVRGRRRRRASSRSRCCAPPATSPAPSSRCARTRPGRSTRSRARSCSGTIAVEYALLPHRGDWRRRDLHDAADEFLVPLERVRGGVTAARHGAPTGRTLRVEGAVVSAVLARAGRSRRAGLQPVPLRDRRDRRARRAPPSTRLDRRPARRPARVLRRRRDARPVGDRDAAARPRTRPDRVQAPARRRLDRLVEAGDRARPERDDRRPIPTRRATSRVDHDLAGAGGPDETRREVHDRAEQVPFADEHLAGREPDAHRRETHRSARPARRSCGRSSTRLGRVARRRTSLRRR